MALFEMAEAEKEDGELEFEDGELDVEDGELELEEGELSDEEEPQDELKFVEVHVWFAYLFLS